MATVSNWNPFGVALDLTATAGTVKRISATQFTVVVNASWEPYYSGNKTNYGMEVTSGGKTIYIPKYDGDNNSSGSGSLTGTYSISGNGAQTKSISVVFRNYKTGPDSSASKTITLSVSVPAWTSYTVKYNANGGTGAPAAQTKWHGQNLTLSSTKPTRTGYSFKGWSLTQGGSVYYTAGATCGKNENLTLYAVWEANTYTVSYNANGGTGAPGSQTKTYGKTLTLSTIKPTKNLYNFLGWATSASATKATYAAGGSYTANAAVTLYAVWELAYVKPSITNLSVTRINANKNIDDLGEYVRIRFDWKTTYSSAHTEISWDVNSDPNYSMNCDPISMDLSGDSGTVEFDILDAGIFDTEVTHTFSIKLWDSQGLVDSSCITEIAAILNGAKYVIDIYEKGKGIAFNKPAELENVCDIGFQTRFYGGIKHPVLAEGTDLNGVLIPNTYVGECKSMTCGGNPLPVTSGTFSLEVIGMGDAGQLMQRLTYCHKTASKTWERIYYSSSWGDWFLRHGTEDVVFTPEDVATTTRYFISKQENVVTAFVRLIYNESVASGISVKIGSIPEKYAPGKSVATVGIMDSSGADGCAACWIREDGNVYYRPFQVHTAGNAIEFNLTWNTAATWH